MVEYLRVFGHVGFFCLENAHEHQPCWREIVPDRPAVSPIMPKRVGVSADHGGVALKENLVQMLRGAGYEVLDFGDDETMTNRHSQQ